MLVPRPEPPAMIHVEHIFERLMSRQYGREVGSVYPGFTQSRVHVDARTTSHYSVSDLAGMAARWVLAGQVA